MLQLVHNDFKQLGSKIWFTEYLTKHAVKPVLLNSQINARFTGKANLSWTKNLTLNKYAILDWMKNIWRKDESNVNKRLQNKLFQWNNSRDEGVHLTLPPHIFSVQVKSGAYYITGQWVRVKNKIKKSLPKPSPLTFYYLLLFFIIKFVSLSWFLRLYHFYDIFTAYFLYEEVMSVILCNCFYSK